MQPSEMISGTFDSPAAGVPVEYRLLVPAGRKEGQPLPLILHLHGARSSAASVEGAKAAYDAAWAAGNLPPAIVAGASTPTEGGFYIDYPGGPGWETAVAEDLPNHVGEKFELSGRRATFAFSMGGYGALKIALRNPERYAAGAALCPVIFAGETPRSVHGLTPGSLTADMHRAMGEDDATYAHNSVYGIARSQTERIKQSGLALFFDCGDADEFGLYDGSVYFDRVLTELGIPHEFHSIPGATHVGEAAARQAAAIRFIGRALWAGAR